MAPPHLAGGVHLHRRIARGTLLEHPGLTHLLLEQLGAHASRTVILVDVDPLLLDEFAEDDLHQLPVHLGLDLYPLDGPRPVDEQREQLSTDVLALDENRLSSDLKTPAMCRVIARRWSQLKLLRGITTPS